MSEGCEYCRSTFESVKKGTPVSAITCEWPIRFTSYGFFLVCPKCGTDWTSDAWQSPAAANVRIVNITDA